MEIQYEFCENGNIKPCPYKDECINCPAGCSGESWWCKRIMRKEDNNGFFKGNKAK